VRVAIVTSIPFGGAGAALPVLATAPGVTVACVILSREEGHNRIKRLKRKLRKVAKIGPLGAFNGIRMRSWFTHYGGADIRTEAVRLGIPLVEVSQVNSAETVTALIEHHIALGVSLGNGYIHREVFDTPSDGMINYHGELLPEYPGALSVVWPIYFGLTRTGFTIHRIDKGIDTGAILLRREFDIAFRPTLHQTVVATSALVHPCMPLAVAEVVSHWKEMRDKRQPSKPVRSFTTPTFWQYLTMERNNLRLCHHRMNRAANDRPSP
jgi:methionyl-tRNA formyltransferase